ncbi:hypothetical protein QBC38DRAFT_404415 [Podospora fimiseda]|uniref:Secreted protein n=1 Tax=Podospora fimiseda TaxID=252190 RepID=A0AAN6YK58_9PEZI|nr:hypothetical protein QBC38DRAFT_404415 [Podospora fimiseda]
MHLLQVVPLFAGLAASLAIEPRQATGPAGVQIASIAFSGTGCSTQTLPASILTNSTDVPVPQTTWVAESGKDNTRVVPTNLNCQIIIRVNHPAGWQYSLVKADYYGRVKLPANTEAASKTTYSFSGNSQTRTSQYYFDGPFDGIYFRNDRYTGTNRQWSPCGTGSSLNITSEVRVGPLGSGNTRPTSMDIFNLLGGKIGLNWQTCR